MPTFAHLALRYLLWAVLLRILYTIVVQVFGLPNLPAVGVMLAAVPAVEIGAYTARRVSHALQLTDWAKIWATMMSVYLAINVIAPAIFLAQFRATLANPQALQNVIIIILATAGMMVLFLWIGVRIGGPRGHN